MSGWIGTKTPKRWSIRSEGFRHGRVVIVYGSRSHFKVWQAKLVCGVQAGKPGQLMGAQKDGVVVACGNGALLLQLVQPAGKGKMQADAWYRGLAAAKEQCLE